MAEVSRIKEGEGMLYRELRLRALREDPKAFCATYATAMERSDSFWIEAAKECSSGEGQSLFFAKEADALVGLAGVFARDDNTEEADLFQMWVAPECRGSGVGKEILDTGLTWAKESGFRLLHASVLKENEHVLEFYTRAGFKVVGEEGREILLAMRF